MNFLKQHLRNALIGLAVLGLIGGAALSQGQFIVTTLTGTELFSFTNAGPYSPAISASNLAAYVQAGSGTAGTNGQVYVGVTGALPKFATMSQDCTITNAGVITCTKTNNVSFGTSAVVNTGTSGATIPLLNGANTYSGTSIFSAQLRTTFGTPTIASGACGATTNGVITSGTNQAGLVTIGSATTTTCTISFSATLGAAPNACVLFPASAGAADANTTRAYVSSITTAQFVITGAALASTAYYWQCI